MAFNGSGVFSRLYSWVNDAAANIKIRADRMDAEMDGFATGLSTCITKDGQTTITANLPMAGFRHTGVGNAAARNNYASFGQVQDGVAAWADAGGTADAITASYSIPITALVDGQMCFVRASAANSTTTPTFSPNGLTARTIVKQGGVALAANDIRGDGHELALRYDLANTRWELLNPAVNLSSYVTLTGTETLSNKTLVGLTAGATPAAGEVGEVIESTVALGSPVSLAVSGTAYNVTSITLTAGAWEVRGTVTFQGTSTTSWTVLAGAINTVSATLPNPPNNGAGFRHQFQAYIVGSTASWSFPVGSQIIRVSSPTTIYLVAAAVFTASTASAAGYLGAVRILK